MNQTADSIEAESALIRSQLMADGADIRHHADPRVILDKAKASFLRRTEDAPIFLKQNASPIGMVLLGGALGAAVTGLLSRSRLSAPKSTNVMAKAPRVESAVKPTIRAHAKTALLSSFGVALGYVAGMFVPVSATEERWLGQPRAVLRQRLDDFLRDHTQGMKMAAANAFGLSRLSATTLVVLALLIEAVGKPPQPTTANSP